MKLRVKNGEHHLWKGGVAHLNDTERKKDMDSFEYRNWRRLVFERDGYTCKVCNTKGIELNAHHKQSYADNPHLRFIEDNGVTLCKQCHIELHKKEKVHGIESDTIKDKLEELNGERK